MAIMPEGRAVIWDPLPENETQGRITPTQIILHTAVDHPGPTNLPDYFRRRNVYVESHFWVANSGLITQMMDTNVRADANYHANARAISIETEDDGDPEGNPWKPAQIDALIRIIVWASRTHDIPLQRCATPTAPGLGWHSMWSYPSDPINLTGPPARSPWTPAFGKTCPGSTRIRQIVEIIEPALFGGPTMPEPSQAIKQIQQALITAGYSLPTYGADGLADPDGETVMAVRAMANDVMAAAPDRRLGAMLRDLLKAADFG